LQLTNEYTNILTITPIKLPQRKLNGTTLLGITEKEIQLKRKEVAHTLMMFEGNRVILN
jgi:hypothetical protein